MSLIERALSGQRVEVETATTDDDGPGARKVGACGTALRENGVLRRYFPKRLEFYKVSPALARWLRRHAREYDILHIHALFSFSSVAAAHAARRAGVPYVLLPHGSLNRYGLTERRPWLKRLSLKWIEGRILRHAAAVHFTSAAEQREAEALGVPLRSVVVPLGIDSHPPADTAAFLTRFPQLAHHRFVLFLSRLDRKKNVEGLLRAFALVAEAVPEARLAVAGDGEAGYVTELQRLAKELGLADRVVWTGFLDGELKAAAFAASQVFVLPSYSENFGIAAAEALMAGLPCVLGEGVAISEDVADAGAGLTVTTDAKVIADAIRKLLDDESLRVGMSRRAAALAADRFSLEAMGRSLHALYSRILAGEELGRTD
jgi:glycosyltransferase involved in cell wall biosynthesis